MQPDVVKGKFMEQRKLPDCIADAVVHIVHQVTFLYIYDFIKNAGCMVTEGAIEFRYGSIGIYNFRNYLHSRSVSIIVYFSIGRGNIHFWQCCNFAW